MVTYPDLARPELVDWVDYEERLAEASPEEFAAEVLARAGDREVWLVWSGTYRTHEGTCEAVANELQRARPAGSPVVIADPDHLRAVERLPLPRPLIAPGGRALGRAEGGAAPSVATAASQRRMRRTSAVRTLATRVLHESTVLRPSVRKKVVIGPSCW